MNRIGWALAGLLFLGCNNSSDTLPYPLVITEDGLGAIHPKDPFDIALLRGKLPGFELERLSQVASEKQPSIIRLKRGDHPIALIASDPSGRSISQITLLSPLIKNAEGIGINDLLSKETDIVCAQERCHYADTPSITYWIEPKRGTIIEITLQAL